MIKNVFCSGNAASDDDSRSARRTVLYWAPQHLHDGITTGNTFYQSGADNSPFPWVQVDLGRVYIAHGMRLRSRVGSPYALPLFQVNTKSCSVHFVDPNLICPCGGQNVDNICNGPRVSISLILTPNLCWLRTCAANLRRLDFMSWFPMISLNDSHYLG